MIDRFSVGVPASLLANRFSAEGADAFQPKYNGAPSQLFPVITNDGPKGFSYFYWGMPPSWSKNKSFAERIINLRIEQLTEKPAAKKKVLKQRCLVPADGFYAWKKVGKKTLIPWRFTLKTKEPFAIAGVWEEYEEGQDAFHTFTILTVPASGIALTITERMPLILSKEQEALWLKKEMEELELNNVLAEVQMPEMDGFTVSPELNSILHDRPSLMLPMPAADQFGNLTLFD
jgi:putative SOS response-associated peptidase YedK